jgi:hypothetical protein
MGKRIAALQPSLLAALPIFKLGPALGGAVRPEPLE